MTRPFATFASRMAIALTIMLGIAACGGGGGGGGGFQGGSGGGDNDSDTYFIQAALKDANGEDTSVVSSTEPATLEVLVTRNGRNGAPVEDIIVQATTDRGLLFPESGTALTDANGLATFRVEAGDEKGASSIIVSVTNEDGSPVTESVNFQLGETGLRLGYIENGTFINGLIGISPDGPISSEGQAILSLAIVGESGLPVQSTETLRITSACLNDGRATIDPENPVETSTGQISIIYQTSGCEGEDTITAELVGSSAQAVSDVEVASPSANGLTFVNAEPGLIVLRGTGGGRDRVEKSQVQFRAVNADNQPLQGVSVSFSLTTEVGGVSLSPTRAVSDAEGLVSTIVSSGDVATVVRVVATTEAGNGGNEVSAVSDVLTVSTGLPDQNSISLSVAETFVVQAGMTRDGVTRDITVRMADKFNNPVPDGTAAVFTTEYGSIEPSCETVEGACTVVWTSQAPRFPTLTSNQELVKTINDPGYSCPSHNGSRGPCPDDLGFIRGGRSTVLVTAIGEESFIDRNGNGLFDQQEASDRLWTNLTEAFLDQNENGVYDPATENCNSNGTSLECRAGSEEIFSDFNNNGAFDANGDDITNGYPDEGVIGAYNGLLCPLEGDGVWCSRELVNVRDSTILILSTDPNWDIAFYDGRTPVNTISVGESYVAYISDLFNSKPPGGATISLSAAEPCFFDGETTFEVPNTTAPGALALGFVAGGLVEYDSCNEPAPSGTGRVTVTLSPGGDSPDYSETVSCIARVVDIAPDPLCP